MTPIFFLGMNARGRGEEEAGGAKVDWRTKKETRAQSRERGRNDKERDEEAKGANEPAETDQRARTYERGTTRRGEMKRE